METGAVIKNNNAYTEGGAVSMSGNANYANALVMRDNAKAVSYTHLVQNSIIVFVV